MQKKIVALQHGWKYKKSINLIKILAGNFFYITVIVLLEQEKYKTSNGANLISNIGSLQKRGMSLAALF